MFFSLSKIFWAVLSPVNLVFLTLLAGALAGLFSKTIGRSITILGMTMFFVFGLLPVGENMLAALENRYQRPAEMPQHIDGILVLGGSFMSDITEQRGVAVFNETGERIIDSLALARRYPDATLLFSGGNGRLLGGDRKEAEDVADFLAQFGYESDNIRFEDQSRTTYENIKFSYEMIKPQAGETWLLVTSAYHMPRAMAVAKAQGWEDIIPYPADYRTTGQGNWLPDGFDMLGNFYDLHVAMHEYIGLAAYQLTGKISLPL